MQLPTIKKGAKYDKKDLQRFYKNQNYSSSFMGYDHFYILALDEKIIGAVMVSYLKKTNKYGLMHALVISKNHQNKGYAKALIQKLQSEHPYIICFANIKLSGLYEGFGLQRESSISIPNYLAERFESYYQKDKQLTIFKN